MGAATTIPVPTPSPASWSGSNSGFRALRYDILGIRGLTLLRFAWTALFIALFSLWSAIANLLAERGLDASVGAFVGWYTKFVERNLMSMVLPMIIVTIADNLPLKGTPRVLALACALVLGALSEALQTIVFMPCPFECDEFPNWNHVKDLSGGAMAALAYNSAIAVAYFTRRSDHAMAAALHASEIARIDAERARLQSTLQEMQARVEPAFLQDALRDVAALYETDRKSGGRMLDLLILYLRNALPQMRRSDSTLEREVGLLRAYLGIIALRSSSKLALDCNFDATLADARVPPMMLVPLVATMARNQASAGCIKVDAREVDHRLRIAIAANGAITRAIAESEALREVRERLVALYGDRASFVVDRRADETLLMILELPHEPAGPPLRANTGARSAEVIP